MSNQYPVSSLPDRAGFEFIVNTLSGEKIPCKIKSTDLWGNNIIVRKDGEILLDFISSWEEAEH